MSPPDMRPNHKIHILAKEEFCTTKITSSYSPETPIDAMIPQSVHFWIVIHILLSSAHDRRIPVQVGLSRNLFRVGVCAREICSFCLSAKQT